MPRLLCLPPIPFGWYYFHRRAANQRQIIKSSSDISLFRRLLVSTLTKAGAHLHFAHVDPDELHLAVQSGDAPLGRTLGQFCQQYARVVNQLQNRTGPVFRPHARIVLIQQEKAFLPLGRYIHWIPQLRSLGMTRGLCWNTDAAFRSRRRVQALVTSLTFRTLSRGSRHPDVQDHAYRAFFDQRPSQSEIDLFENGSAEDPRFAGDLTFIANVCQQLGLTQPRRRASGPDVQDEIRRQTATVLENFRAICAHILDAKQRRKWTELATVETVRSKSRVQPLPMIRGLVAACLVSHRVATLSQVEDFLACRPGTLAEGRRRRYARQFQAIFNRSQKQLLNPAYVADYNGHSEFDGNTALSLCARNLTAERRGAHGS